MAIPAILGILLSLIGSKVGGTAGKVMSAAGGLGGGLGEAAGAGAGAAAGTAGKAAASAAPAMGKLASQTASQLPQIPQNTLNQALGGLAGAGANIGQQAGAGVKSIIDDQVEKTVRKGITEQVEGLKAEGFSAEQILSTTGQGQGGAGVKTSAQPAGSAAGADEDPDGIFKRLLSSIGSGLAKGGKAVGKAALNRFTGGSTDPFEIIEALIRGSVTEDEEGRVGVQGRFGGLSPADAGIHRQAALKASQSGKSLKSRAEKDLMAGRSTPGLSSTEQREQALGKDFKASLPDLKVFALSQGIGKGFFDGSDEAIFKKLINKHPDVINKFLESRGLSGSFGKEAKAKIDKLVAAAEEKLRKSNAPDGTKINIGGKEYTYTR